MWAVYIKYSRTKIHIFCKKKINVLHFLVVKITIFDMEVLEVEKCQPWNNVLAFPEFLSTFLRAFVFKPDTKLFLLEKFPFRGRGRKNKQTKK